MQINSLFCKPICKPDKARQFETGETELARRPLEKLVAQFPGSGNRAGAEELLAQLGAPPPAPGG